jgi:spore germination protein GerM
MTLAGCSRAEQQPAAIATQSTGRMEATLYFLSDDRSAPIGVRRSIARTSPSALGALRALIAGPTAAEHERGLTSAIPKTTQLLSLHIDNDATAIVDLSALPQQATGVDRVRVITQVTRSLVGVSGIEQVRLRSDRTPWGLWRMSGGVDDVAYGYDNLLGFFEICAAKPGTEAVADDCFSALP